MNIYLETLKKYWKYNAFRPLQEEIIRSVAEENKDTLCLLPTGGGKSVIFQVPALTKNGICIVVSPLIALMIDQVENLKKKGIKALAIHSGMSKEEIDIALDNSIYGGVKFLYVSPERLETEIFKARIVQMSVNLIAVDEAHCISQWGYDFRPSYLNIAKLRDLLPGVPVLALTATATPDVVDDIQEKLHFRSKNVFRKSFERKNLIYIVRDVEDKQKYLLKIINKMPGASGIVYVRNRKQTKDIADFLVQNKISADYFHAGLNFEVKNYKQENWKNGFIKIIVCTNAFGMGIDKPDVRFVVHMDLPDSLEAYFQEAGRAGRDEQKAYSALLFNNRDKLRLDQSLAVRFPPIEDIKLIYNALGNFYKIPVGSGKGLVIDFNMAEFVSNYKFNIYTVFNSMMLLQNAGYIEVTDELANPSRLHFTVSREDLYKIQVKDPQLDIFVKLILRNYSGVFTDFVVISEEMLAKKANTTRDVIYQYLKKLAALKVINYIPQKKTPLLIFTEERLDTKAVFLSPSVYKLRKEKFTEKINSAVKYATSVDKCRSLSLLHYFGDFDAQECGQCDICTEKKRQNDTEIDSICLIIKDLLKISPMIFADIVEKIPKHNEQKIKKAIEWMIDENIIHIEGNQLIIK